MNFIAMSGLLFSLQEENLLFFSTDISLNALEIFFCSFRVLQGDLIVEKSHKVFTVRRGLRFIFQLKSRIQFVAYVY